MDVVTYLNEYKYIYKDNTPASVVLYLKERCEEIASIAINLIAHYSKGKSELSLQYLELRGLLWVTQINLNIVMYQHITAPPLVHVLCSECGKVDYEDKMIVIITSYNS